VSESYEPPTSELQDLALIVASSINQLFGLSVLVRRMKPKGRFRNPDKPTESPRDIVTVADKFPKVREQEADPTFGKRYWQETAVLQLQAATPKATGNPYGCDREISRGTLETEPFGHHHPRASQDYPNSMRKAADQIWFLGMSLVLSVESGVSRYGQRQRILPPSGTTPAATCLRRTTFLTLLPFIVSRRMRITILNREKQKQPEITR
jgi:hypothetical protein